jgi:cytochrome c oxidase cbb3-type subunit III
MNTQNTPTTDPLDDQPLRPHSYDGIQEYDNKLPNWWLWTLWLAVLFAVVYWCIGQWWGMIGDPGAKLEQRMQESSMAAAKSAVSLTDDQLWKMSRDQTIVAAGRTLFLTTCASCHQPDLSGKIGPNLKDNAWIHGGKPNDIIHTITNGVPAKGMPTWGPILGRTKITEAACFILSFHDPSEKQVVSLSGTAPAASGTASAPAAPATEPAPATSPAPVVPSAPAQAPQ